MHLAVAPPSFQQPLIRWLGCLESNVRDQMVGDEDGFLNLGYYYPVKPVK